MLGAVLPLTIVEVYALRLFVNHSTPIVLQLAGCAALNTVLYLVWAVYIYPNLFSPLRHLPAAPGGQTPLGHSSAKFGTPVDPSLQDWGEAIQNDGLYRVREAFGGDAVVATSPDMFKAVLLQNAYGYEKAYNIRKILRQVLGDGLIVVEGDVHKFQKQRVQPSFGAGNVRDLYPLFWEKSCELVDVLGALPSLANVAFAQWCDRATLDIIGVAGFGEDFNTLKDPDTEFATRYRDIFTTNASRAAWFALSFFLPERVVANIPFWRASQEINVLKNYIHGYALSLAQRRRKELSAGLSIESKAQQFDLRRPDVLSTLVSAGELTDSQLADQILTFLAAGHETTASALVWATVALAKDPALQERLRHEIREHIAAPNGTETPAAATLEKLPLLNAVCSETLRLFPTVPFSARTAREATRLGDTVIPKGTQVWLPIWVTNRSTRFWGKDAHEFRPERWITDGAFNNNGGAPSNFAQLTFLHGPRSCVGQGFARAELRCLIAALVGRFHFDLADDVANYRPVGLITVKPENGALLNIRTVDGW